MKNDFDKRIDEVLHRTGCLLKERGIFHAKVHFSSGQITLWSMSDPYNYRVCHVGEFLEKGFPLAFEAASYPINARVPPHKIATILAAFKSLRLSGKTGYLRAGSLNIINGRIGLNFSNDSTRYLDYREFLRDAGYRLSGGHRRVV
ncbi:MAG: hypothetical protein WCH04_15135 [Gammaproteobacteria bacterium]